MSEPIYTKEFLLNSVNGKQIKVTATSSPGTFIHTALTGLTSKDEVWLYATNNDIASKGLVLEWGGIVSPDDLKQMAIPSKQGDYLIVPGHLLTNGLSIRAYAETADVICISGWVNRIQV